MGIYKEDLLNYGLKNNYYSPEEYSWCIKGKKLIDYSAKIVLKDSEQSESED
jgi:hypothetical protein